MKSYNFILSLTFCLCAFTLTTAAQRTETVHFDFCGTEMIFKVDQSCDSTLEGNLSQTTIASFYNHVLQGNYLPAIKLLKEYQHKYAADDWLYYQLIRRTAQHISPKEKNYYQYTLFKWLFLTQTGYDAILAISNKKLLLYIQCDENIYNIPYRIKNGKQYVCLNYHDYFDIDINKDFFTEVKLPQGVTEKIFSYKVTHIPDFAATEYLEKDLHFSFYENDYHFKVKWTPQIQMLFKNYPVVDYESYLNIPLSRETYNSLIPQLKKNLKRMNVKNGVDYLMRFTRYAFLFETDTRYFGAEKRLSPEQTLLYDKSDCEDRVALFFYLVKEIYNLPMIVLAYPSHVGIAVQFDKPIGTSISYQGKKYSVCEPTPQKEDLSLGQTIPALHKSIYQIAYVYQPKK